MNTMGRKVGLGKPALVFLIGVLLFALNLLIGSVSIPFADFMDAVRRGGFKSVFEDIMFSTRVMIDNRDDFLEFLQNLIKNLRLKTLRLELITKKLVRCEV